METSAPDTLAPSLAPRWRRFLAFIVDYIAIGLVGWAVATVGGDTIVSLHDWARLIGLALMVAYFAVFDSGLVAMTSPGKRLLGIRVVDSAGASLTPGRAGARATVVALPIVLNGLFIPAESPVAIALVGGLLSILLFGLLLALLYLFFFNRRTRQALHDWLTGAFVVMHEPATSGGPDVRPVWRPHLAIVALLLVLAGVAPVGAVVFAQQQFGPEAMQHWAAATEAVAQHPGVVDGSVRFINPGSADESVVATAWVTGDPEGRQALADEVGQRVRAALPGFGEDRRLTVVVTRAWNMGVAYAYESRSYCACPSGDRSAGAGGDDV